MKSGKDSDLCLALTTSFSSDENKMTRDGCGGMGNGGFEGWVRRSGRLIRVGQMGCDGYEEWVFRNFKDGCGRMLKLG